MFLILILSITSVMFITGIIFIRMAVLEVSQITPVKVTIKSARMKGRLTCLHLTDLHLYGTMPEERFQVMLKNIDTYLASARPDFIFITGDMIDRNDGIDHLERVLKRFAPSDQVFAVLGNHDYYQYHPLHVFSPLFFFMDKTPVDMERLKAVLAANRVTLLQDACVTADLKGIRVEICGIDAMTVRRKKVHSLDFGQKDYYHILLSHYPDAVKTYRGHYDLMLSGHTHGGQITFFGIPLTAKSTVRRAHASGLSLHDGKVLYVSRGMGVSHYIPFRFFAPPDISLIVIEGN